jgi:hypothetical protein
MNPMRRISLPKDFKKANFCFNKKHSKIFALHVLVFLLEVKNCNYNFGFFGLSQFQWVILNIFSANAASVNSFSDIASYFIAVLFFLFQWSSTCALGVSIEFRFDRYESNFLIVFEFSSKNSISYRYDIEFSQPWCFHWAWLPSRILRIFLHSLFYKY